MLTMLPVWSFAISRHGLAHQERALQVDPQHGVEIRFGHVQEIRRLENAGVVDQHVDAAMRLHCLGDHRVDLRLVAHVAMHVEAAQFRRERLAVRVVHVHDHRLGAFAREAANAGLAYALGAAGDDADTAAQAEGNGRGRGVAGVHARMVPALAAMKSSALRLTWSAAMPGV